MRSRPKTPLNFSGPSPVLVKPRGRPEAPLEPKLPPEAERREAPEADILRSEPERVVSTTLEPPVSKTSDQPSSPEAAPEAEAPAVAEPMMQIPERLPIEPTKKKRTKGAGRPPAPPSTPRVAHEMGWLARHAYLVGFAASTLWAAAVATYVGYFAPLGDFALTPINLAWAALVALAPIATLMTGAFLAKQGARLAAETHRAHALSEAMVAPATLASEQTVQAVKAMRSEIEEAVAAARNARAELAGLREALTSETRQLNEAAAEAQRTAKTLSQALSSEREAMTKVGQNLEQQASGLIDAVQAQSRMVADASDLAQAQLREAEAALAARAADLAAAAGEAQDAARLAADDLARQTIRLETAGSGVAEQIRSVEEGLSQQRAALVTAAIGLRTEQEDFSAQVETQRAQLVEALTHTRLAAADLGEASARGADSLQTLVRAAAEQFRELNDLTDRERAEFASRATEIAERFRAMAAQARDELVDETSKGLTMLRLAAEEARQTAEGAAGDLIEATGKALTALKDAGDDAREAADAAAEAAKARVDRVGEAAFEAGKRADEILQSSISAAQRMIEQSAALVDEAAERSAVRLESNLAGVRSALGEVDTVLAEIDSRAQRLPAEAQARVDEIRASVESGLEALTAAARKASEETQAVDAAFQERVKRNYEMLTEAVRLMGVVSGTTSPASGPATLAPSTLSTPSPSPAATRRDELIEPAPMRRTRTEALRPSPEPELDEDDAAPLGLRPRLKLTPTAGDQEMKTVFEPAPRKDGDSWSWRDLLGGMDAEPEAEALDDDALADRLIDEIGALGVDPNALLPRTRVEEAAAAYQAGDAPHAREVVRRVAPAAVRRISRRVLTEKTLRAQAERFVDRYGHLLEDASRQDREGFMSISLLASEAGRAFLLIDAAIGDLV